MITSLNRVVVIALTLLASCVHGRAAEGDEHLFLGNPSSATAEKNRSDNFLVKKPQYALSYNSSHGTPNWVSWHLSKGWLGSARRSNPFAPDLSLPQGFVIVRPNDYRGSNFDRGHLCPAGDRSVSKEDMDATFLMSNMVPQAPELNRVTWEKLESYCRDQVRDGDQDLYIVAGPAGQDGATPDTAPTVLHGIGGQIVVPSKCWKVVLVVPADTTNPAKVTAAEARVFAVIMPNTQSLNTAWRTYAVSVKNVEKLTGYTFFDTLAPEVAEELKSRDPETRDRPTKSRSKNVAATTVSREKKNQAVGKALELPEFVENCIVGNRRSKKYHLPDGRGYETATNSKNAVFFKTAADADAAGYTQASR